MPGPNWAPLRSTTVSTRFPTQTRTFREKSASTSIQFGLPRANFGASTRRPGILFTWTCGTTILSAPDFNLPSLPRDEGDGPVFAEPWQAQVFALAVRLSEQGHFTWKEWTVALAHELKSAADRGEADDGSRYY